MINLLENVKNISAIIPDIAIEISTDYEIIWLNKSAQEFFGEIKNEKCLNNLFSQKEISIPLIEPIFTGKVSKTFIESWFLRHDKKQRLLACWFISHLNELDERRIILTARDVTDEKIILSKSKDYLATLLNESTLNLEKEKELFQDILNTISVGIMVLDQDNKIEYSNKILKEYYWKFYRKPLRNNFLEKEENYQKFEKTIIELQNSENLNSLIVELAEKSFYQFILFSENKEDLYILEVRDVSSLVELDNLRKQFISSISHELRTPITVVNQSITNLLKYKLSLDEITKNKLLDAIKRNATTLENLIEDIFLVSMIENKKTRLKLEEYDPKEIVNKSIEKFSDLIIRKNLEFKVEIENNLKLIGDLRSIKQIFDILIENALIYSRDNGYININAINHYVGRYNEFAKEGILISFSDFGVGIKQKDISHIFKRFFRTSDVENTPRSGMGLSIAKDLAQLHSGNIFVESEYNNGNTFYIFFPKLSIVSSEGS